MCDFSDLDNTLYELEQDDLKTESKQAIESGLSKESFIEMIQDFIKELRRKLKDANVLTPEVKEYLDSLLSDPYSEATPERNNYFKGEGGLFADFGADSLKGEKVIYRSKKITPEQELFIGRTNSANNLSEATLSLSTQSPEKSSDFSDSDFSDM
ncbi:MAG: hypothetical protein Ta2F_14420 [Termitinemataceae bacterium]|nr:MAG: hypothetical protein Ta2F_14420 [Termitinemataceae bacterium]